MNRYLLIFLFLTSLSFAGLQDEVRSYLLSESHPMFETMDKIFRERVIANEQSLENAGFNILFAKPRSFIRVARHPALHGYLIKANLDEVLDMKHDVPSWKWFVRRCEGVKRIHTALKKHREPLFSGSSEVALSPS